MWDKEYGLPCIVVLFEGLQTSAVPRPAPGSGVVFSCSSGVFVFSLICFIDQPRTVQEYVRVRVQSPAYIGYSSADDLSVDFRRMGYFVSDNFGGVFHD